MKCHWIGKLRHIFSGKFTCYIFPVTSTIFADQNPIANVPVVVIHAGRPRQFELRRHCRAHGGADGAVPCWGGGWEAADVAGAAAVPAAEALAA